MIRLLDGHRAAATFGSSSPRPLPTLLITVLSVTVASLGHASAAAGQAPLDRPPRNLARVELERSRSCVSTLADVAALDVRLDPLAERSRRLMAIAEAIAIEDRSVAASLDSNDPVESEVRSWFSTDSLLAVRFVESGNEAIQEQRSVGRASITGQVSRAIAEVRAAAESVLTENEELIQDAGPCDGAIFVRPAVIEACTDRDTAFCSAARAPADTSRFLFVDAPEEVWSVRELRPWTRPTPLAPGPSGLEGGRSIGYARIGNVVLTVAFAPLLEDRTEMTPAKVFQYEQANQALALTFDHPDIAFTPGLAIRAALPQPLADEQRYLLHFGEPEDPDTVWEAEAGTGLPLQASVPLSPAHVLRLRAGDPLVLTAVRGRSADPLYSIALGSERQAEAVGVLLTYMASRLNDDLKRLAPPNG